MNLFCDHACSKFSKKNTTKNLKIKKCTIIINNGNNPAVYIIVDIQAKQSKHIATHAAWRRLCWRAGRAPSSSPFCTDPARWREAPSRRPGRGRSGGRTRPGRWTWAPRPSPWKAAGRAAPPCRLAARAAVPAGGCAGSRRRGPAWAARARSTARTRRARRARGCDASAFAGPSSAPSRVVSPFLSNHPQNTIFYFFLHFQIDVLSSSMKQKYTLHVDLQI